MSVTAPITEFAERLCAAAPAHRRVLVLAGAADWCRGGAAAVLQRLARIPDRPSTTDAGEKSGPGTVGGVWVGRVPPTAPAVRHVERGGTLLGQEFGTVVFDAHTGFDVDGFGAVSGTVRGGGLLLLLTPPLAEWPRFPDPEHARIAVYPVAPEAVAGRFLGRLTRELRCAEGVAVIEQGAPLPPLPSPPPAPSAEPASPADPACRTADQAQAVAALIRVVRGHRRRPLVLTSDRGRGKSAALGIAAARLLQQGVADVLVTAPRLEAVAPVFEHAGRLLPGARTTRGCIEWRCARIAFAPPDELSLEPRPANLLLVDEAAAIPAPLLEQLLTHYSRIAFATTVHGYEGTGRGFAVRFNRVLDARTPDWASLHLRQPIRWADHDPLERFVFRALLLDAAAAPDAALRAVDPAAVSIGRLDRVALAADEATLAELFGLLVLAHYRTRPLDLRHLLDGPNLTVWAATHEGHVLATALVAGEGGFDATVARGVWEGRIRPHGHLLPESLSAHLGLEAAPRLRSYRVMRIAVHPAVQGRGLGRRLLAAVTAAARASGGDLVGTSFGATEGLLAFWARCGLSPVRLALKRGAASGAHSVLLLQPTSTAGEGLYRLARARFLRQLPHLLGEPVRDLEPALAVALLAVEAPAEPELDEHDWRDVVAFAFGRRVYEMCIAPVWHLTLAALADPGAAARLTATGRAVLVGKVLQKRSYAEVARLAGLSGREAVVAALREALRPLVHRHGPAWAQAEAEAVAAAWEGR